MDTSVKKQVIIRPVLSEKSINFYKNYKVCTFWVSPKATKKEIGFSFKEAYGIEPKGVRTVVTRSYKPNKNRRSPNARESSRKSRTYVKKAYINIDDNTLDIFESIK